MSRWPSTCSQLAVSGPKGAGSLSPRWAWMAGTETHVVWIDMDWSHIERQIVKIIYYIYIIIIIIIIYIILCFGHIHTLCSDKFMWLLGILDNKHFENKCSRGVLFAKLPSASNRSSSKVETGKWTRLDCQNLNVYGLRMNPSELDAKGKYMCIIVYI
jgi:hypothetical protein